jgi:O-antigen ligase
MLQSHPNPSLTVAWKAAQIGLILLPFSVLLASFCFLVTLIQVSRRSWPSLKQRKLNWAFLALSLGLIFTACFAEYPTPAWLGLGNFIPCFWFFAGFRELLQTPTQLRRAAWLLVLPSVPVVLIGLGAFYGLWSGPVLWVWGAIVDWPLAVGGTPSGRLAAIFAYANVLASYLHTTFALALGLFLGHLTQRLPPLSKWLMALLVLILALEGWGLILTQSRNAWGVALVTLVGFALELRWYQGLAVLFGLAGSVAWAAFGPIGRQWLQQIIPAFFWARLNDQMFPDRPVSDLRVTQWEFAWSMTLERPWTGWGLRNFTPVYQAQMHSWLGHPHNFFLMLSAETGIPLTLGLMATVGWILAQGWLWLNRQEKLSDGHCLLSFGHRPMADGRSKTIEDQRWVLLTYMMAFAGCVVFSCFDVTFFDYRINMINWFLLAGIAGVKHDPRSF